jgi:hypothetical protein
MSYSRTVLRLFCCVVAIVAGYASIAAAQEETVPHPALSPAGERAQESDQTLSQETSKDRGTVVDLSNGELVRLGELTRFNVSYGASVNGAYDTNFGDYVNRQSRVTLVDWNPFIALIGQTPKMQYALQYNSTITNAFASEFDTALFQQATAMLNREVNRTWGWDLNLHAGYGNDMLRMLSPLRRNIEGDVSTIDPSAGMFADNNKVFAADASASVHVSTSVRDRLSFAVGYSYFAEEQTEHSNGTNIGITYSRDLSLLTTVEVYGQAFQGYGIRGSSYGGGIGFTTHPSRRVTIHLRGGPEFQTESGGKRQGFNLNGGVTAMPTQHTTAYIIAGREFSTIYPAYNQWQDSAVVGLSRQLGADTSIAFDAAYSRATAISPELGGDYHGYFLSATARRKFTRALGAVVMCRRFDRRFDTLPSNRTIVMVGLEWTPGWTRLR